MDLQQLVQSGLAKEIVVVIIAALPVSELRGAIPVAINAMNLPWQVAVSLALIGNVLPVPVLLLFLDFFYRVLKKIRAFNWVFQRVFAFTRRRTRFIERYHFLGLMLFVGVPLPFTGAWTGAIAAFLLGMRFWPAFMSILGGIIIAAIIVTVLALLGWIGATIAGVVLVFIAVVSVINTYRERQHKAAAPPA